MYFRKQAVNAVKWSLATVAVVATLSLDSISYNKNVNWKVLLNRAEAASNLLPQDLNARVIATGIPGAGAVAEVGNFLRGGPNHDNPGYSYSTQPGQVQDPKRVFVASTSNFGAPLAYSDMAEGSILSIDPAAVAVDLSVVTQFAADGTQASTYNGLVHLYTAQSPAFLNGALGSNPNAVTLGLPAVSLPTGISINNGNGRPWISNAPAGANKDGTVTVIDPQGFPLVGAPDPVAGGVFTGTLTNRKLSSVGGLTSATLGTAIVTKSPDLSGRAVFLAVGADGSVVQIHVSKGIDEIAPPATVTPLLTINRTTAESTDPSIVAREGMAFNWAPTPIMYIADPQANRLVVLDLSNDDTYFYATRREISVPEFNVPIDVAPTTREIASGSFASNSTLSVGSDLYVLNRGDNTIVRMSQAGVVQQVRTIRADLIDYRANGIAVSSDGQTIYVTVTLPNGNGALLALPAFGQSAAMGLLYNEAKTAGKSDNVVDFADFVFNNAMQTKHGVGPLFNQQSCAACHGSPMPGGMGLEPGQDILTIGRIINNGDFSTLENLGGPTARQHSVSELGTPCGLPVGPTPLANVISLRNAMTLRGNGLIDDIAPGDMLANMQQQAPSVRGRLNILADGRIGKFGWKANVATLSEFMGDALRNEMGMTNPVHPNDEVSGCGATLNNPELDALALQATAMFLNSIDPPSSTSCSSMPGATVFSSIGCADCHTPSLPGHGVRGSVQLYADLLLHDMGSVLADQMKQGSAKGNEWRTMPLWSLRERGKFLHDGRATSVSDAISAHGGQAQMSRDNFGGLNAADVDALLQFLQCI